MLGSTRSKTATRAATAALCVGLLAPMVACSTPKHSDDEIVIGFALSQSGSMAPFDQEPGNAALLRIDEINAAGGIDGKSLTPVVKDVRSNPETVGIATTELLGQGVDVLITPCDFDLSAPAAIIAQTSGVPAVSICAGDPKMADTTTLGDYVFSANAGSDVEGTSGAKWAFGKGWRSAYVLQDESIEYTKSTGRYFTAAFSGLGGTIVGTDAFPGGDNVNISAQATRLRNLATQPDFVYVPSWNPGGATAIRQLREAGVTVPIVGPAALDGKALAEIVGDNARDISYTAFACYVYCTGADSPELTEFADNYAARFGAAPSSSYTLLGYNMMTALAAALDETASLSGKDIRDAIASGKPIDTPVGQVTYFSSTCHKILDYPMTVIGLANGEMTYLGQQRVDKIPDIADGNSCAGGL
jgi:branched-chain amino acid transport system substrate-binding protein